EKTQALERVPQENCRRREKTSAQSAAALRFAPGAGPARVTLSFALALETRCSRRLGTPAAMTTSRLGIPVAGRFRSCKVWGARAEKLQGRCPVRSGCPRSN